jgi:hypothetical protein
LKVTSIDLFKCHMIRAEPAKSSCNPKNNLVSVLSQDGKISLDEFATMMKAGTDWRKASRQYSRQRFSNLSLKLQKDGSIGVDTDTK